MKAVKRSVFLMLLVFLMAMIFVACSGDSGGNDIATAEKEVKADNTTPSNDGSENEEMPVKLDFPTEAVTVTLGIFWGDGGFETRFKEPIEEQFPHITVEYMEMDDESLSQGIVPDLMLIDNQSHLSWRVVKKNLQRDLMPFIKKYQLDLGVIEPSIIADTERYSPDGMLYSLPHGFATYLNHYNKEIFDKFGEDYPVDKMSWGETIELAKLVTRNEGGIQYRGLDIEIPVPMATQYPLKSNPDGVVEPTFTTINQPYYKKYLEIIKAILEIPGNYADTPDEREQQVYVWGKHFMQDKNVAMYPIWSSYGSLANAEAEGTGFDWDIVTYPEVEENRGYAPASLPNAWLLSPVTEVPDAAFQVLAWLTMDEEQAIKRSADASAQAVNTPAVREAFARDREDLQDKNMKAVLLNPPAAAVTGKVSPTSDNHDLDAGWGGMYKFFRLETDINTTLAEWQEAATILIQEDQVLEAQEE